MELNKIDELSNIARKRRLTHKNLDMFTMTKLKISIRLNTRQSVL